MPKVNQQQLSEVLVPVPSPAEQHRIAGKVDELMVLLGRVEEHLAKQTKVHTDFAAAAVHHLDA